MKQRLVQPLRSATELPHPENLSVDVATFFNHYNNLRGSRLSPQDAKFSTVPVPHLQIPILLTNTDSGDVYGGEAVVTWQPADWWRLQGGYSYLKMEVVDAISSRGVQHQFVLRSLMSLGGDFKFDPTLRYVDSIAELGVGAYCELDLRLGYRMAPGVTLSLVGQNLLHDQHQEFSTPENREYAWRDRARCVCHVGLAVLGALGR